LNCDYFGKCGSCTLWRYDYNEQLKIKIKKVKDQFKNFYDKEIEIFISEKENFRNRAEFRIWHSGDKISYAMNGFGKKDTVLIKKCQIVQKKILNLMPDIISYIQNIPVLREKLFAVEYINGENILLTLIYHKKIDEIWFNEAKNMEKYFNIHIIGRCRGIKLILSQDFIYQKLQVLNKKYIYKIYENSFLQPNTKVNEKMISWVKDNSSKFGGDFLELYCGHGNFTLPLSENFDKVLATEVSKNSIRSALENVKLNDIKNISFVRLSSEELTQALNKERDFRRLKDINLEDYSFDTVFVDPPRAGIDKKTIQLLQRFSNIIYISCNPLTLKRDLEILKTTHQVEKFAIFDQFVYTEHLECGIILSKMV